MQEDHLGLTCSIELYHIKVENPAPYETHWGYSSSALPLGHRADLIGINGNSVYDQMKAMDEVFFGGSGSAGREEQGQERDVSRAQTVSPSRPFYLTPARPRGYATTIRLGWRSRRWPRYRSRCACKACGLSPSTHHPKAFSQGQEELEGLEAPACVHPPDLENQPRHRQEGIYRKGC